VTTRITVTTGDGGLLDRNAQQQAAARQAALTRSQAEKAAALGEAQLRQDRINAGLDPATGRPLPSAGSTLRRVDQQPAAFRSPVSTIDLSIAWVYNAAEGIKVVSGNGSTQTTVTATQSSPSAFNENEGWIDYTAEYISDWSDWFYWPYGAGYWEKRRMINSVSFQYRLTESSGAGGSIILPTTGAAVYTIYSEDKYAGEDYELSVVGNGNDDEAAWGVERGADGDIFEIVYVQAGPSEDPETLFSAGTRRRGAELIFNVIPTVDSRTPEPVYTSSINKSVVVSDTKIKQINTPATMTTRMGEIFGVVSDPTEVEGGLFLPGYSLSVFGAVPGLTAPFIDKRITYAGVELQVSPWTIYYNDIVNFTQYIFDSPVITDEGVYDLLSYELLQTFGLADVVKLSFFSRSRFGTITGGNSLAYRVLDGTYTFTANDIPDALSDLITLLSPLPTKFQIYAQRSYNAETDEPVAYSDYYTSSATQVPFDTYKNVPENYRSGAEWYDFGDPTSTGAPNIPGTPASINKTLVPLSSRVALDGSPQLIISTTFGESAYCLQSLAALGFTSSDLRL
jgi:hypothetical protein